MTDRLPAKAFASDSSAATDPNMAISLNNELDPWTAAPDVSGMRYFGVDLNDLVDFGKMTVKGAFPDRKVNQLVVQTSYNNTDFTTVGAWPKQIEAWDGGLEGVAIPIPENITLAEYGELSNYIDVMSTDKRFGAQKFKPSGAELAFNGMTSRVCGNHCRQVFQTCHEFMQAGKGRAAAKRKASSKKNNRRKKPAPVVNQNVLVRVRGAFYIPERQILSLFALRTALAEGAKGEMAASSKE